MATSALVIRNFFSFALPPPLPKMSYADKQLTCRDCGAGFEFTAGQQEGGNIASLQAGGSPLSG